MTSFPFPRSTRFQQIKVLDMDEGRTLASVQYHEGVAREC
jgi:hypothetical protein